MDVNVNRHHDGRQRYPPGLRSVMNGNVNRQGSGLIDGSANLQGSGVMDDSVNLQGYVNAPGLRRDGRRR